jgi:hypothetical protein
MNFLLLVYLIAPPYIVRQVQATVFDSIHVAQARIDSIKLAGMETIKSPAYRAGFFLRDDGNWAAAGGGGIPLWEADVNGGIMPAVSGSDDPYWEYDENGFIMPKL